jgi:hypothetical protein
MTPEKQNEKWSRLTGLARKVPPDDEPDHALSQPVGLATRVAAQWCARVNQPDGTLALLERASWVGAALALLLCVLWISVGPSAADPADSLAFDGLLFAPGVPPEPDGPLF